MVVTQSNQGTIIRGGQKQSERTAKTQLTAVNKQSTCVKPAPTKFKRMMTPESFGDSNTYSVVEKKEICRNIMMCPPKTSIPLSVPIWTNPPPRKKGRMMSAESLDEPEVISHEVASAITISTKTHSTANVNEEVETMQTGSNLASVMKALGRGFSDSNREDVNKANSLFSCANRDDVCYGSSDSEEEDEKEEEKEEGNETDIPTVRTIPVVAPEIQSFSVLARAKIPKTLIPLPVPIWTERPPRKLNKMLVPGSFNESENSKESKSSTVLMFLATTEITPQKMDNVMENRRNAGLEDMVAPAPCVPQSSNLQSLSKPELNSFNDDSDIEFIGVVNKSGKKAPKLQENTEIVDLRVVSEGHKAVRDVEKKKVVQQQQQPQQPRPKPKITADDEEVIFLCYSWSEKVGPKIEDKQEGNGAVQQQQPQQQEQQQPQQHPQQIQEEILLDETPEVTDEVEVNFQNERIQVLPTNDFPDVPDVRLEDKQYVKVSDIEIRQTDLDTLTGTELLSDNIINTYLQLIVKRKDARYPKTYAFNTFFYSNLVKYGYERVRKVTRKVDIFSYEIIFVPVHIDNNHWCLTVIDMKEKKMEFYDSLYDGNTDVLPVLRDYFDCESMDKKNTPFDFTGWTIRQMMDIPRQRNGYDCGVFTCQFAEWASRRTVPRFSQKHMLYYRKRIAYEIVTKKLLHQLIHFC